MISDDCSTDNTWQIIQSFSDPRIVARRNSVNIGEYNNRNKILEIANGKYILYIDGDDILYKNSLQTIYNYIQVFPAAKSIWGVHHSYFDFIVFPYEFQKEEITGLNFLSTYPISQIGFAETVFDTEALKMIGGFNTKYSIGDTYIKRRFACEFPVLLVVSGFTFWRQTGDQASKIAQKNLKNLTDLLLIDKEILYAEYFPLKGEDFKKAELNYNIRRIKLIFKNSILKLNIVKFFRLLKVVGVPTQDIKFIFQKGDYSYKLNSSGDKPLMNNYNFKK